MTNDSIGREARPQVFDREAVWWVVRDHRWRLARVSGAAFVGGLLEALFLVVVTRAAFAITDDDDTVGVFAGKFLTVNQTLVLALGLLVGRFLLAVFNVRQGAALGAIVSAQQRSRLTRAFLDASWEVQHRERSGSLQELLTHFVGQANILANNVTRLSVAVANLVAIVGVAVAIDPVGALALIVAIVVLGIALRPIRSTVRKRSAAAAADGLAYATTLSETSQLGLELHVFHVQNAAFERTETVNEQQCESVRRQSVAIGLIGPTYLGLAYACLLGALALIGLSEAGDIVAIGTVMLVMLRSLTYGQTMQASYSAIVAGLPYVERLRARLDEFERGHRRADGNAVGAVRHLRAEDVSFEYAAEELVLDRVTFTIEEHEIVGIIGPSGGGKSTLVQLILGLRDPTGGRVVADGSDICDLSRAEWARKATFVPQSSQLIAGTISENIRFLRDDVTDDDVDRAARLASLHEDISRFPDGYGRQVGERGGNLSGGQQQRLCIARALVEDPDVLILDEPTSALDVRSEHLVTSTLLELREKMTIIVIAHRLSTLDICDRIMVLQDGVLRAFDTPENLEQTSEFYREALLLSGMR